MDGMNTQDGGVFETVGMLPRSPSGPADLYEFILRRPSAGGHGEAFYYDNGPPEALAWVLRRLTGQSIATLVSNLLWQPLGPERDGAYIVDQTMAELAAGGFFCTLRDLARLGELLRNMGTWNGRRVVPESFIQDVMNGGNRSLFAASAFPAVMPGGSYRSYFWVSHDKSESFLGNGRFGQRLFVAPGADLVVAQFGSAPGPFPNPTLDLPLAGAYRALVDYFGRHQVT